MKLWKNAGFPCPHSLDCSSPRETGVARARTHALYVNVGTRGVRAHARSASEAEIILSGLLGRQCSSEVLTEAVVVEKGLFFGVSLCVYRIWVSWSWDEFLISFCGIQIEGYGGSWKINANTKCVGNTIVHFLAVHAKRRCFDFSKFF